MSKLQQARKKIRERIAEQMHMARNHTNSSCSSDHYSNARHLDWCLSLLPDESDESKHIKELEAEVERLRGSLEFIQSVNRAGKGHEYEAAMQALGWMYAECNTLLDKGKDPRTTPVPDFLARYKEDMEASDE